MSYEFKAPFLHGWFWWPISLWGGRRPAQSYVAPKWTRQLLPLQLDVIDRALVVWSNQGEVVLTPFMGIGSEVHEAVVHGRKAIGVELKASYYRQADRNVRAALKHCSSIGALFTSDSASAEAAS